ncbi:hypothetical protein KAJ89_05645 [Candidatus Parcubacteria bacterium]|nr:hypothetical protein [Candidatus Parcubacteria bacterium]
MWAEKESTAKIFSNWLLGIMVLLVGILMIDFICQFSFEEVRECIQGGARAIIKGW